MLKPRRKHPGFNSLQDTSVGRLFLGVLAGIAGEPVGWTPLERDRAYTHFFRIQGERRDVLLVETKGQAHRDEWVTSTSFLHGWDDGQLLHVVCTSHRWDPWLFATLHGLPSPRAPSARTKRLWQQIAVVRGEHHDRVQATVAPPAPPPADVSGVPLDQIAEVRRHSGLTDGQRSPEIRRRPLERRGRRASRSPRTAARHRQHIPGNGRRQREHRAAVGAHRTGPAQGVVAMAATVARSRAIDRCPASASGRDPRTRFHERGVAREVEPARSRVSRSAAVPGS